MENLTNVTSVLTIQLEIIVSFALSVVMVTLLQEWVDARLVNAMVMEMFPGAFVTRVLDIAIVVRILKELAANAVLMVSTEIQEVDDVAIETANLSNSFQHLLKKMGRGTWDPIHCD